MLLLHEDICSKIKIFGLMDINSWEECFLKYILGLALADMEDLIGKLTIWDYLVSREFIFGRCVTIILNLKLGPIKYLSNESESLLWFIIVLLKEHSLQVSRHLCLEPLEF